MLTFVQELRQALTHEPVTNALPMPPIWANEEEQEKFRLSRTPKERPPVDDDGADVLVLSLDQGVPIIHQLMKDRGDVYGGEVWEEIWATRARYGVTNQDSYVSVKPESEEEQVRLHLQIKCPKPEHAAVWVAYKDGTPLWARVFDRPSWNLSQVWVQWIVGSQAIGLGGLTVLRALWDVGIREVHWKTLPQHALNQHFERLPGVARYVPSSPDADERERHYRGGLLHGRYIHWVRTMEERPSENDPYLPRPRS
jgi:hypothetical protein